MLSNISDRPQTNEETTIIGCGSVGSIMADNLSRRGNEKIHIVDDDKFEPHNVARHLLGSNHSHFSKAHSTVSKLKADTASGDHRAYFSKFEDLDQQVKANLLAKETIIDCTATDFIHSFNLSNYETNRVFRCYIANQGRLGIVQYCNPSKSSADFFDLDTCFLAHSAQDKELSNWLKNDLTSETVVGLSCSSTTLKMPLNVIQSHTSSFLSFIDNNSGPSAVMGINSLTEKHYPKEFKELIPPTFRRFQLKDHDEEWNTTITEDVKEQIFESSKLTRNEIGGFLIGNFDYNNKRICIIKCTVVRNAKSSVMSLELPPLFDDKDALALIESSSGGLKCLGTWHSHPGKSTPSQIDLNTLNEVRENSSDLPMPFLMFIQGKIKSDFSIKLGLPNVWK
ncbi:MAG: ThiF family adenylyltransferase [Colwellia sp.]|jgi:Dinucleotide-utilizing enzymes involved in molybdopterin and thiamine biosynthesis family 2